MLHPVNPSQITNSKNYQLQQFMKPIQNLTFIKRLSALFLGLVTLGVLPNSEKLIIASSVAHEVEVSGDIAATFHLEPNHNPKAGETAQVWFALTKRGGEIVPLSQCNCQLSVYIEPRRPDDQALISPPLQPISAEKYQGIPGADVVFPEAGRYELELTGEPKNGASFKPFQLSYGVTVY